jgi:hypothetical protein
LSELLGNWSAFQQTRCFQYAGSQEKLTISVYFFFGEIQEKGVNWQRFGPESAVIPSVEYFITGFRFEIYPYATLIRSWLPFWTVFFHACWPAHPLEIDST